METRSAQNGPLYAAVMCGFMERFSNFGLFTVLVLKLKQEFNLSDDLSYTIFGLFLSISYGSLMLGGFAADRWFGIRKAITLGGIFLILGNLCLATKNLHVFYIGLSIVVVGIALFKVNCASLVGLIYKDDVEKREKGFTIYYCGMNVGAVISPIVFGFLAKFWGWSSCFYVNAILLIITLSLFLKNNTIRQLVTEHFPRKISVYIFLVLFLILGSMVYLFPYEGSEVLIFIFAMNILFFIKLIFQQQDNIKKHLAGILLINLCCVFFFSCSLQVTSSITLFVDREIPKHILGIDIPTSAFSSLDPLFVVLMAPVFLWFWKTASSLGYQCYLNTKMALGIVLASAAFGALYFSAQASMNGSAYLPLFWLVMANILLGGGEVCIAPPVFTAISKYSPQNLKSTMIGSWYLFIAIAGFIAGQLSKLSDLDTITLSHSSKMVMSHIYSHAFIIVGVIALVSAMIVYCLRPVFSKLLTE